MCPEADVHEVQSLARSAVLTSALLAKDYVAVHPALLHNILVNTGFKTRGLCYHWAEDLHSRLSLLGLRTLRVTRVVSWENTRREHHALLVSPKTPGEVDGVILDAWRRGGKLYWTRVSKDHRHLWKPFLDSGDETRKEAGTKFQH